MTAQLSQRVSLALAFYGVGMFSSGCWFAAREMSYRNTARSQLEAFGDGFSQGVFLGIAAPVAIPAFGVAWGINAVKQVLEKD